MPGPSEPSPRMNVTSAVSEPYPKLNALSVVTTASTSVAGAVVASFCVEPSPCGNPPDEDVPPSGLPDGSSKTEVSSLPQAKATARATNGHTRRITSSLSRFRRRSRNRKGTERQSTVRQEARGEHHLIDVPMLHEGRALAILRGAPEVDDGAANGSEASEPRAVIGDPR